MDREDQETLDKSIAAVDMWIDKIATDGQVGEMEAPMLRSVLESYGANFELTETEKQSLMGFKNAKRRLGMDAVWGKEKVKNYRIWLKHWLEEYEKRTGKELPVIKEGTVEGNDTKTSGGFKFFTDLTVFAAGLMDQGEYKRITERRARKGRDWQTRDPEEPVVPTPLSSFPPEFPHEAWLNIKSLVA